MKKEQLRKLHDECKEHPFWKTLDIDFHADCMDALKKLINGFIDGFTKDTIDKCPQATLLLPLIHNIFDSILKAKIMYKQTKKKITETPAFGNYVMCMQAALQLIHYYLDDIFDEDEVVGYEPYLHYNEAEDIYDKCTYKTYCVRQNEDGTYRVIRIITKDEVQELIEWNTEAAVEYAKMVKYFAEQGAKEYAESNLKKAQYYESCVKDLKDNKELHYKIK